MSPLLRWNRYAPVAAFAVLGLSARLAFAQPLNFFKNYFVTGDYEVDSVGLRGLGDGTGSVGGPIIVPDPLQHTSTSQPPVANNFSHFHYYRIVAKSQ